MRRVYVVTGYGVENGHAVFGRKARALAYARSTAKSVSGKPQAIALPVKVTEERTETRQIWPAVRS